MIFMKHTYERLVMMLCPNAAWLCVDWDSALQGFLSLAKLLSQYPAVVAEWANEAIQTSKLVQKVSGSNPTRDTNLFMGIFYIMETFMLYICFNDLWPINFAVTLQSSLTDLFFCSTLFVSPNAWEKVVQPLFFFICPVLYIIELFCLYMSLSTFQILPVSVSEHIFTACILIE